MNQPQYLKPNIKAIEPMRLLLWGMLLMIGFLTLERMGYWLWIGVGQGHFASSLPMVLSKGFVFDFIVASFFFLPMTVMFVLSPEGFLKSKVFKVVLLGLYLILSYFFMFMSLAEVFFFDEFSSRFNFIAVDYLVYSQEVTRNAIESYPMPLIMTGLTLAWLPVAYIFVKSVQRLSTLDFGLKKRGAMIVLSLVGCCLAVAVSEERLLENDSVWNREVSKNTFFALITAYGQNSIDFDRYYTKLDPVEAIHQTHEWLEEETTDETKEPLELGTEDEVSIVRNIQADGEPRKLNVVLVIIESLSARFMGHFSNPQILTENLDKLADEGLFFSHVFATGTRTVRGLEAIMLSLPPTPGQSIVRRPKSQHLFNLGYVLKHQGYQNQFVYGGFSYFDNMKNWFESNGFDVVDRGSMSESEIQFANAWGVCDEDLFDRVLKEADRLSQNGAPFFQAVLTTSNHRPYSYPDGRIDIPSQSGREGAVKYTDYAIGRFIKMAKGKKWFDNTLFIFVADHDGAVAGGGEIVARDYEIPMIFYAPKFLPPQINRKMGSQMDLAPTLLGFLNMSYQSRFFGQNLLKANAGRALMGTYQKIALMEPGFMTVLAPNHKVELYTLNADNIVVESDIRTAKTPDGLPMRVRRAVGIYQTASDLFSEGQMDSQIEFSEKENVRKF